MTNQTISLGSNQAVLVFLKPKRLLPPAGEESRLAAAKRMLAETVHDYLYEYRANHFRSHRKLLKRIDELNASSPDGHPKTCGPTQQDFLSAIRSEKYRRAKMAAWEASLTAETVDATIDAVNAWLPRRIVRFRPRGSSRASKISPSLASQSPQQHGATPSCVDAIFQNLVD
ncbi:hypothetical protein ACC702_03805 [Rhizobium ruizarguesonis]|jgi:hypothetical protein